MLMPLTQQVVIHRFLGMVRRYCLLLLIISLFSCRQIAMAQTVNDAGFWTSVNSQGVLGDQGRDQPGLRWWFDGQLRYLDDSGGYNQSIMRPAIGYAITPDVALWWGYAWVNTLPTSGAPAFNENRMWEQMTWTGDVGRAKLLSRSRLEQRFVETGDDTGWRFRQSMKIERPFEAQPRLSQVAWDETFFDLNETDWGQQGSFSQNRLFLGLGWKCSGENSPKIEFGYLNQFIRGGDSNDRSNHVAALNWFWSF